MRIGLTIKEEFLPSERGGVEGAAAFLTIARRLRYGRRHAGRRGGRECADATRSRESTHSRPSARRRKCVLQLGGSGLGNIEANGKDQLL